MKRIIIIDPGHGGNDNGATYGFSEEDDTNLSISYLLRCELRLLGYEVYMTRERDIQVLLSERVTCANNRNAGLFVSIHCDAFHKETAQGMSVHIHPNCSERSRKIAQSVLVSLVDMFPDHRNRGVRESDFYVLSRTKMPAILIECEFLSNPETRKFLKEPENQLQLARAIANGIEAII